MSRKPAHYTSAGLLYSTVAYCDQWKKTMAIYDKYDALRIVISEDPEEGGCNVLLIGDDDEALYWVGDIELGTVKKNMDACFKLYLKLEDVSNPRFVYSNENKQEVETYQILTHTKVGAMRHGQFHAIPDAFDKILPAMLAMANASANMRAYDISFDDEPYYSNPDSLDSYIHSLTGGDPLEKMFVRSGVFDD